MKILLSKTRFTLAGICLILAIMPAITKANVISTMKDAGYVPTGKGWGIKSANSPPITSNLTIPQNGINYHGGPVMGTTASTIPNVYYIWYGNWSGNSAKYILTNLALGIGRTPYFNINSTYQDGNGNPVQRIVNFPHYGVNDNYSQGTSLSDSSITAIVNKAISTNQLPLDANGIYFVLTSSDVRETSGFCSSYCGWHNYTTINTTNIKYAFVGDPTTQCMNGCSAQSTSPNNNPGADAMASVIAHELEETVTDPNLNAWYDSNGEENADKCAWNFGQTKTAPNGSEYNVTISKLQFLIQQNWLNANNGLCAMSY
jgi:phosphate-induced protein 1